MISRRSQEDIQFPWIYGAASIPGRKKITGEVIGETVFTENLDSQSMLVTYREFPSIDNRTWDEPIVLFLLVPLSSE